MYCSGSREPVYIEVRGNSWGLPIQVADLGLGENHQFGTIGLVESCGLDDQGDLRQALSNGPPPAKRPRRSATLPQRVWGKGNTAEIHAKMEKVMALQPCAPLTNLCDSSMWIDDNDLKYIRQDDKNYKNFIDMWQTKICSWTVFDFNSFYKAEGCQPTFNCGFQSVEDKYYNVTDSVNVISELLLYQFDNCENDVKLFLCDLYNIIDRKIPKCNTLLIQSPPSAGKNYFIDMVMDFLWNKGQLGNPNKYNAFPFNAAEKKRILLWNEPNYEAAAIDTLKMITAGDAVSVKVKYKNDTAVYKTPLIILTNNDVSIMHDPAFADRIRQYRWKAAPMLKKYDKYPIPTAFFDVLIKFDVILDNSIYE